MFAGMLLRMARESSEGGWLGSGEQAGADGIMEFAEQHIARTMAKQGVFGIQQTITQAMQPKLNQPAKSTR
jgi:Rod binding domain-containing protein